MLLTKQVEDKHDVETMTKFELICEILIAEEHCAWARKQGWNTSAFLDNSQWYVQQLAKRDLKVALLYM